MGLWLEHSEQSVNNSHHSSWLKCIDFGDLSNSYGDLCAIGSVIFIRRFDSYTHRHTFAHMCACECQPKIKCVHVYAEKSNEICNGN